MSKLLTISNFCTAIGMIIYLIYQFTQLKPLIAVAGVFLISAVVISILNLCGYFKEKKQEDLRKSSSENPAD